MKKSLLIVAIGILLTSCGNKKWEYKIVKVAGQETFDYTPMTFDNQTGMLNNMGKEGWELVSVYTETNTAFPNFGNSEYVTGLRTNTRTAVINFVFKRRP